MRSMCIVHSCRNQGKHVIPQDTIVRSQWIRALRLDVGIAGRQLKKHTYICSDHFKPSDFITIPALFEGEEETKRLKNKVVPSIFPWTATQNMPPASILHVDIPLRTYSRNEQLTSLANADPLQLDDEECENETHFVDNTSPIAHIDTDNVEVNIMDDLHAELCEVVVQSSNDDESPFDNKKEVAIQTCDNASELPVFTSKIYEKSDTVIHFYTGLENYEKVKLVFYSLGDCVRKLKYFYGPPPKKVDDVFEQFFMTLIILRLHKSFEEISMMYVISIKQVSNIFITWIRLMSLQWRKLDLWIDKATVKAYIPLDFHDKYPNTRVIIDATECPIKKPGLPMAQQVTFSTYKNRNTIKSLIGIAPSGLITYVSPCYGGSASDRHIIERSDILQRFDYNDEIMVDKGLNVQDIFISYGVKVNMPAFFKKGNQIGPETLRETRKVASKRVHIERIIGQMKTYKILTQPMNRTETLLSSDIMLICAMFVNFRSNIINKNA